MNGKTAVVTGASGGIGEATCTMLLREGWRVVGISRRPGKLSGVEYLSCDLRDDEAVRNAIAEAAGKGKIDFLISNAGMGISGAAAFAEMDEVRRIFDVNCLGAISCVTAAREYLAENASIVFVTSVAANFSIPFQVYYSATKSALSAFARGLRMELSGLGVRVCAVSPGDVHTGFTDARRKSEAGREIYGDKIRSAVASMEKDERGGMAPEAVAKVIVSVPKRIAPPPVLTVGGKYNLFTAIAKILPARTIDWIVGKMYS